MNKIAVIGVPSSAGAHRAGQELAPQLFRRAGFVERLRSARLRLGNAVAKALGDGQAHWK
jgi:arginase